MLENIGGLCVVSGYIKEKKKKEKKKELIV